MEIPDNHFAGFGINVREGHPPVTLAVRYRIPGNAALAPVRKEGSVIGTIDAGWHTRTSYRICSLTFAAKKDQKYLPSQFFIPAKIPPELPEPPDFLPDRGCMVWGDREIVLRTGGASRSGMSRRVPWLSEPSDSKPQANPILYARSFCRIQFAAFIYPRSSAFLIVSE